MGDNLSCNNGILTILLMYGCQARIPVDIMFNPDFLNELPHHEYAALIRNTSITVSGSIWEPNRSTKKKCMTKRYTENWSSRSCMGLHSSVVLQKSWTGPYQVVKELSDITYRIRNIKTKCQRQVVHFNRLKPYLAATEQQSAAENSAPGNLLLQVFHSKPE